MNKRKADILFYAALSVAVIFPYGVEKYVHHRAVVEFNQAVQRGIASYPKEAPKPQQSESPAPGASNHGFTPAKTCAP